MSGLLVSWSASPHVPFVPFMPRLAYRRLFHHQGLGKRKFWRNRAVRAGRRPRTWRQTRGERAPRPCAAGLGRAPVVVQRRRRRPGREEGSFFINLRLSVHFRDGRRGIVIVATVGMAMVVCKNSSVGWDVERFVQKLVVKTSKTRPDRHAHFLLQRSVHAKLLRD